MHNYELENNKNNKKKKNLLILAYSFPPVGGGRVRRVIKFVKYLPYFGWNPIILTVKKPIVNEYDYELLKELPKNLKVYRTASIEFGIISKTFKNLSNDIHKKKSILKSVLFELLERIKYWIFIPDTRIGWIPFAVVKGLKLVRREDVDAIMVIAEPFSSFISGTMLKFLTKKPLVLDFRDEWSEYNKYFFPKKSRFTTKIEEKMEACIIKNSDIVISVTERIIDNFRKRYPDCNPEKFVCITNGFDPDDFRNIPVSNKTNSKKFTIAYAGLLYSKRSPSYLFKSIQELLKEDPETKNILRLLFLGEMNSEVKYLFDIDEIKQFAEFLGFLGYRETLFVLKNSDLLIYLEDELEISNRFLPAKIFEYMGIGKPVLALANEGTVKDVIEQSKIGLVVPRRDIQEIKSTIKKLIVKHIKKENIYSPDYKFINRFHRKRLTGTLVKQLNSLVI